MGIKNRILYFLSPRALWPVEAIALLLITFALNIGWIFLEPSRSTLFMGGWAATLQAYWLACLLVSGRISNRAMRQLAILDVEATDAIREGQLAYENSDQAAHFAACAKFKDIRERMEKIMTTIRAMP